MDRPASSGASRPILPTAIRSSVRTIIRTTNAPFDASYSIESRKNCRTSPVSGGGPKRLRKSNVERFLCCCLIVRDEGVGECERPGNQGQTQTSGLLVLSRSNGCPRCAARASGNCVRRARNHTRDAAAIVLRVSWSSGGPTTCRREIHRHQDPRHPLKKSRRPGKPQPEALSVRLAPGRAPAESGRGLTAPRHASTRITAVQHPGAIDENARGIPVAEPGTRARTRHPATAVDDPVEAERAEIIP